VRLRHILQSRLRSVFLRNRRESDLREELQFHLERETEHLVAAGMRTDAARLQALRTFGAVEPTKEACRDARSTVLLDSVLRDIRFTWRSFRRAPLVALTIVTTVGLGLGLVAVVFTILNAAVFRADHVRNPSELFAIDRQRPVDAEPETFTRPQYEAILRETGVFSDAFATTSDVQAWIEGSRREGRLVTGNFFGVLGVSAARGRTLTPSDDEPGRPPVMVLSHRGWTQHYASDPGVLDRTIRVNGTSFQVVGVMPEDFRGLEVIAAPEFWAPLSVLDQMRPAQGSEGSAGLQIVGRLKRDLSRGQALAQLLVWDSRRVAETSGDRPAANLVLESKTGTVPLTPETMLAFMPLFFAFGLILMIGCANVANLLLARGVARQREIGIRLAIGASRSRIIWQLLTESLLLALVSAALAFGISRLVLRGVVYAVISTFPPDIGNLRLVAPPADWRVALFLVAGAMAATLFFALAPALQATRLELVRAVRGEVVRDGRPGRARNALVALQVTGSVLLLICAAVFLRSSWAAATVDPGIHTAGVLGVRVVNEQRRAAILDVVTRDPLVESVAASWPGWLGGLGGLPALAQGAGGKSSVTYEFVSPEYFGVFGIDLVRGRGFIETERSANAAVAIVSESVARQLWPGVDPIGQVVRVEPNPAAPSGAEGPARDPADPKLLARSVVVVGVARDVAGFRLGGMRLGGAGVYMPVTAETAATSLTIHVRGDAERGRHELVDRLAAIDPNMGEVSTMQTIARAEVYLLAIPFWLTLILGALALLLTLSGLFSVLSYLVEQRTREIGVRMALGATSRSIGALVLWQSARPVGIGLLLGGGLTAALGAVLLATPAAEQIGSSVRLFDPVAYTAGLLWILVTCTCAALIPALRAARIDPVGALRQD
jgi:putative ABC transport system permease protein